VPNNDCQRKFELIQLVFVDDATSRLMHLQFVESESTFAYFHAARAYLEAWGKPVAFYSDMHGVFPVNHPGALGGDGMTQFGLALHALSTTQQPRGNCASSTEQTALNLEAAFSSSLFTGRSFTTSRAPVLAPPLRELVGSSNSNTCDRSRPHPELSAPDGRKRRF
jgi:hypothetical protein